jgi:hypothetical protein
VSSFWCVAPVAPRASLIKVRAFAHCVIIGCASCTQAFTAELATLTAEVRLLSSSAVTAAGAHAAVQGSKDARGLRDSQAVVTAVEAGTQLVLTRLDQHMHLLAGGGGNVGGGGGGAAAVAVQECQDLTRSLANVRACVAACGPVPVARD